MFEYTPFGKTNMDDVEQVFKQLRVPNCSKKQKIADFLSKRQYGFLEQPNYENEVEPTGITSSESYIGNQNTAMVNAERQVQNTQQNVQNNAMNNQLGLLQRGRPLNTPELPNGKLLRTNGGQKNTKSSSKEEKKNLKTLPKTKPKPKK